MRRRQLVLAASALAIAPWPTLAQRTTRIPTVGLLWSDFAFGGTMRAFSEELKSRGYIEQKSILIESRYLVQTSDELDSAAEKLVAQKVDVIFAVFPNAVRAARKATQTIPIVMVIGADPIAQGFAKNLNRPGGNVTGATYPAGDLQRKRLEILKDTIPGLRRVAVLTPTPLPSQSLFQEAAAKLDLALIPVVVATVTDLGTQVATVQQTGAQAIFWVGGTLFGAHYPAVVEAVGKTRLPAIYPQSGYARRGGLMSYASSQSENFRIAATYVDRILKGAKPADLPIEQASKFEFVVNLKTAKVQGIRIPETTLLRATEVIE